MQNHSNTDSHAINELILSCVGPVEQLAHKYSGGLCSYEDFISIGMVKVCEVAQRALTLENPLAYLARSAQNAMIDEWKRFHHIHVVSLDAPLGTETTSTLYDVLPDYSSPSVTPVNQRVRAVQKALQRLTPHQRKVLRRRHGLPGYGTHSVAETAQELHISDRAARAADFRARQALRSNELLCNLVGVAQ